MSIAAALLAVVVFTLIGVAFGILTGLVPGVHVNTVATFILAFQVPLFVFVADVGSSFGAGLEDASLLVSVLIVGMLVTHTFLDIIPSIFLGAPDDETALSVLPGHRMMKQGRGYEAIKCSALGSFGAVFVALLAVFPARVLMGSPVGAYDKLMPIVPWLLIAISGMMIWGEKANLAKMTPKRQMEMGDNGKPELKDHLRQRGFALLIFLMSGIYGLIVLRAPLNTYNILPFPKLSASMLFPMFSGLFGIAGLFLSLWDEVQFAPQKTDGVEIGLSQKARWKGITAGSFAGSLVGWFPGISSASATVVAQALTNRGEKEDADKEFIIAVSGVNTANAIMNVLALFVILKARSGAMQAVATVMGSRLVSWEPLGNVPSDMALLLLAVVIAGFFALVLVLFIGKWFARVYDRVPYRKLTTGIILMLIVLVALLSGPVGLGVLAVGVCIGLLPVSYTHLRAHET